MNNYLNGYLASIPESEYQKITEFLKNNIIDKLYVRDEDKEKQLNLLLSQIVKEKQPATQNRKVDLKEKPGDTHKEFFSTVYIDLNYLFKVINLLYNAIDSYASLAASYLSDIKSEIHRLEVTVSEIRAKDIYSANSIIITETFKDTEYFEDYNDATSYLFADRDGKNISQVNVLHSNSNDKVILGTIKEVDLLHAKNGEPLGKVEVLDYRGVPTRTYAVTRNAVDNSDISYWDCSVIEEEPVNIAMDGFDSGGAYIKFRVRLPVMHEITEVAITPYCVYPVEICDIMIGGTSICSNSKISINTIVLRSAKIKSDEITFILRQKNYVTRQIRFNEKEEEAVELWSTVLNKKLESYTGSSSRIIYSGSGRALPLDESAERAGGISAEDTIYSSYISKYESEITNWNREYIKERVAQAPAEPGVYIQNGSQPVPSTAAIAGNVFTTKVELYKWGEAVPYKYDGPTILSSDYLLTSDEEYVVTNSDAFIELSDNI